MGMVAALWDVLAKAANLAQMSGLHAVMLVAAGMSIMRIPHSRRECAKLERCSRRLHALLKWPTGCGAVLLCSELGVPVVQALVDAAGLVDSYNRSTLWCRVRSARSMAIKLRGMRDVVDSYCVLLLFINAAHLHLLQDPTPPRSTDNPSAVTNCPTGTSDAQRANDIGSQTCNATDLVGSQSNVPASGSDFACITVQGGDWSQ